MKTDVPDDNALTAAVAQLSAALLARRWTMAAAESCTGGWIAKVCTDRAGSSDWFERGFVTYSNAAKRELLGVDGATLDRVGAVSEAVARGMAEGARGNSPAAVAVATKSATIAAIGRLTCVPLISGMAQKAQGRRQPSATLM